MSQNYDLLITIDPSTGISPGYEDRSYYPGQKISGSVNLTVYSPTSFDQMRVALLGFQESTHIRNPRERDPKTWKEKHIFLKQLAMILPGRDDGQAHFFNPGESHVSLFEFQIPEFSVCETCNRSERLPPSMVEAKAEDGNNVFATASITYQVEVSVELRKLGDIFYHEKFNLQPLATPGLEIESKKSRSSASKPLRFADASASGDGERKKSLLKHIFSSSSSRKQLEIPLRLGVTTLDNQMKIYPGRPILLPATIFLFDYAGNPNLQDRSQRLFSIKTLQIKIRYLNIQSYCAGFGTSVQLEKLVYNNKNLNVFLDLDRDFTYNKTVNAPQKELRLFEDITGHEIDIDLDGYDAEFPMHCGQIGRKNAHIEFTVGVVPTHTNKIEHIAVSVPYRFLGVEDGHAPPGPPPSKEFPVDYKASYSHPEGPPPAHTPSSFVPPPADVKSLYGPGGDSFAPPAGPPAGPLLGPSSFVPPPGPPLGPPPASASFAPPAGPPPGASDFSAPTGPPPGAAIAPPSGPPPGHLSSSEPEQSLIDLDDAAAAPPPSYTETHRN